jgi:two-component system response regulator RegX3
MTMKAAVLVVEDEAPIRDGLCDMLAFHGHEAVGVESGEEGLRQALERRFGLVVLDIMLPGMSGFDVCRQLRARRPRQAILMLTARGSEADVLEGFRSGADDYVTKPFSVSELTARIDALLRRADASLARAAEAFAFGPWQVEPCTRTAVCGEDMVSLTAREVALLCLFARERGRIVSRRTLLLEVWGINELAHIETRTVDMHLAKLRRKLEPHAAGAIETVRGEGYRFGR